MMYLGRSDKSFNHWSQESAGAARGFHDRHRPQIFIGRVAAKIQNQFHNPGSSEDFTVLSSQRLVNRRQVERHRYKGQLIFAGGFKSQGVDQCHSVDCVIAGGGGIAGPIETRPLSGCRSRVGSVPGLEPPLLHGQDPGCPIPQTPPSTNPGTPCQHRVRT